MVLVVPYGFLTDSLSMPTDKTFYGSAMVDFGNMFINKIYNLCITIRVTRLGEVLPIWRLFIFGSFL
jgi:hypothetical protein